MLGAVAAASTVAHKGGALTSRSSAYAVAFGVLLAIHIVSALIGFGMLALSGLYASWGAKAGAGRDQTDVRRFFGSPNGAARCLWAVPFTGALALWFNRGATALGQAWALAAAGCWVIAIVVAIAVVWPAEEQIRATLAGTPGGAAGPETIERLCRPVVRAAAWADVLFVVALGLMVLKPGQ